MAAGQKFEDAVRAYEDARIEYADCARRWIAKNAPTEALKEDDFKALDRRYQFEFPDETRRLSELEADVVAIRAELDRRWIEAHEDLAGIRRLAEGLPTGKKTGSTL